MKFIAQKHDLNAAISAASKATAAKSNIQALEGVLLRLEGNLLSVTGYDLEMGLTAEIAVQGVENGAVIADGKLLGDIIRKLDGKNDISIEVDSDFVMTVKSGKTKLKVKCLSADEYPNLPEISEETAFKIDALALKTLIAQTIYATAQTDIKPVHMGCRFKGKNGTITVDAVDGVRLARAKATETQCGDIDVVIPAKTLQEAFKNIADDDGDITICISGNFAVISKEGLTIVTRLLIGDFINVDNAVSFAPKAEAIVKKSDIQGALERLAILTDKVRKPVVAEFSENGIALHAETALGAMEDFVEAEYSGDEINIGFNGKYLLDAVFHAESDIVRIQLAGELNPMKITEKDGGGYQAIVLPVRLK